MYAIWIQARFDRWIYLYESQMHLNVKSSSSDSHLLGAACAFNLQLYCVIYFFLSWQVCGAAHYDLHSKFVNSLIPSNLHLAQCLLFSWFLFIFSSMFWKACGLPTKYRAKIPEKAKALNSHTHDCTLQLNAAFVPIRTYRVITEKREGFRRLQIMYINIPRKREH